MNDERGRDDQAGGARSRSGRARRLEEHAGRLYESQGRRRAGAHVRAASGACVRDARGAGRVTPADMRALWYAVAWSAVILVCAIGGRL